MEMIHTSQKLPLFLPRKRIRSRRRMKIQTNLKTQTNMKCERVKTTKGMMIVCRAGDRRKPRCHDCKSATAEKLCDFVIAKTIGGGEITCDRALCIVHTTMIGDKDYCYEHAPIARSRGY